MIMAGIETLGTVVDNHLIGPDVYRMELAVPEIAAAAQPGTFVHLQLTGGSSHILRRPFGVAGADLKRGTITVIYRLVGEGTRLMAALPNGSILSCLGPLGRGFTLTDKPAVLIGGGTGMAPLLFLADRLAGCNTTVIVGGKTASEVFWTDWLSQGRILATTDDGTAGHKGFAVDILAEAIQAAGASMVYACGPQIMMEKAAAIAAECGCSCEVSLESYMGCGTGGCLGCVVDGRDGKRYKVCHDGPVFPAEEVFFHA
jgi:dihydroorotate dehydrogenase electron transfer subunit